MGDSYITCALLKKYVAKGFWWRKLIERKTQVSQMHPPYHTSRVYWPQRGTKVPLSYGHLWSRSIAPHARAIRLRVLLRPERKKSLARIRNPRKPYRAGEKRTEPAAQTSHRSPSSSLLRKSCLAIPASQRAVYANAVTSIDAG